MTHLTHSAEETMELGRLIAQRLPARAVVMLIGNLGAGKTTLAKGILNGLGLADPEQVTSPTFTLIHEYPCDDRTTSRRGYHIDLYRLDTPAEIATLGLDELFDQEAVILIEWGERFPQLMPPDRLEIHLATQDPPETTESEEADPGGSVVHAIRIPAELDQNDASA